MANFPFATGKYRLVTDLGRLVSIKNKITNGGYTLDDEKSFYVCCTITCPQNIHNKFNDYPLLPIQRQFKKNGIFKLLSDLYTKEYYFCSIFQIMDAVKRGYILKTVHYAIEFNQSFILRPYMLHLLELRKADDCSQYASTIYKRLCNAIFG